jgi:hypothetical protein
MSKGYYSAFVIIRDDNFVALFHDRDMAYRFCGMMWPGEPFTKSYNIKEGKHDGWYEG